MSNARAAKRRKARELAGPDQPSITLTNPVANHYESFIVSNAAVCERVVKEGSARGQRLILAGAGPSLRDTAPEYARTGDVLWGCNSAMPWLFSNGYPVSHGFAIDQTTEMVNEWWGAPDVDYLLASTCHPHLVKFLLAQHRRLTFFHNYVGIPKPPVQLDGGLMSYEDWLYSLLFEGTVRVGSGLNSVTRAIDVALFMGFEQITVLGADCALRVSEPPPDVPLHSPEYRAWMESKTELHADGGHGMASNSTAITMHGEIDGRLWVTKPDMMVTAVFLEKMRQKLGDRLVLVGDTLPNALKDKPESFLDRLPHLVRDGERIKLSY